MACHVLMIMIPYNIMKIMGRFVLLSGMKKRNIAYGCGRLDAAQSVYDNVDAMYSLILS
jgi:hypothetical protein